MADMKKERGLGRGLSALLADVEMQSDTAALTLRKTDLTGVQEMPIEYLEANRNQPRKSFDSDAIAELAASIHERGIVQPIIVRKIADDRFQIVAGERRWRAAQQAQLHQVPVLIREYSDTETQEIALIENIQRENLNAIEEAIAYQTLIQTHNHTQDVLANNLGKSRSHIANLLRLLNLPQSVQQLVIDGQVSMGHARALLASDDPMAIARSIMDEGLSVRAVEQLIRRQAEGHPEVTAKAKSIADADTVQLQNDLAANLKMKVAIDNRSDGSGSVKIKYRDLEQLDRLCKLLGQ